MSTPSPAGSASPPAPLEHDFGFALGLVFRSYLKAANAVAEEIPGGPRGYQVLAAVAGDEAGSQSALAHRLGIDRTVMTYLIDDLEHGGLVERRQDPADRRNRHIVVTAAGRQRWREAAEHLQRVVDHVLGALPEQDRATFRGLLCRLAARASELDPVVDACQVVNDIEPDIEPDTEPDTGPTPARRTRRPPSRRGRAR